ncbi:hypothetical protein CEXT_480761 [Caerostris extrusa]|uniref:Uncharacterized protein n=1 Tax=Caerostris extrusa TaxID=172846 RepID=A0AAV4WXI4_CAEEX|nr:hypothetical protein CEXT_480761 [Caerostris extrusa]
MSEVAYLLLLRGSSQLDMKLFTVDAGVTKDIEEKLYPLVEMGLFACRVNTLFLVVKKKKIRASFYVEGEYDESGRRGGIDDEMKNLSFRKSRNWCINCLQIVKKGRKQQTEYKRWATDRQEHDNSTENPFEVCCIPGGKIKSTSSRSK